MEKKLIYDREFATAYYVSELKLAEIIWKNANTNSEQYRKVFEDAFAYVVDNKLEFWHFLSDTTQEGVVSPEDRKWFQKVMVPKVDAYGLKKGAVVSQGTDPFKRYYLNMILRWINRNSSFKMKIFNSAEKAYEWFRESFNSDLERK